MEAAAAKEEGEAIGSVVGCNAIEPTTCCCSRSCVALVVFGVRIPDAYRMVMVVLATELTILLIMVSTALQPRFFYNVECVSAEPPVRNGYL